MRVTAASQGIYRVNGVKTRVEKLCQAFENGKELVELSQASPHDISNVLKLYLRQVRKRRDRDVRPVAGRGGAWPGCASCGGGAGAGRGRGSTWTDRGVRPVGAWPGRGVAGARRGGWSGAAGHGPLVGGGGGYGEGLGWHCR